MTGQTRAFELKYREQEKAEFQTVLQDNSDLQNEIIELQQERTHLLRDLEK